MHFGVYEFEVFQEEGRFIAVPYDMEGATQGEDFEDLCLMVADWLKMHIEDWEIAGKELPTPTFGNKPRHGGTNMVFGISAGIETIEKVTASEAARMLGVTQGRVSQMIKDARLYGWREGRNAYVSLDSVRARLTEKPRAGRPLKVAAAL
ncbi:helix-turn-helix domain-containing protein [Olsenella sp. An270]|uniref:helix-turn-helix domain-containing protein n=1 Tax=Olsenella sp. An270 TaxID=1965615 RepID=UPI000B39A723|nr:helix-turn-helix domain-containing protein [Olsenella sp. An270]OUO60414.1 hypothetical protein B5F73_03765 [Olsenella sp. An270]